MPNPTLQRIAKPFSMQSARGTLHHGGQREIAFHSPLLVRDYFSKRDDFTGTLDSVYWTATNTGAASAAPVFNAQAGGAVRFVTGGGNPGVSTLYGTNAINVSDDNPLLYARFKWPAAITNFVFEIGLVNVATTKTTQVVSDIDVVTIGNGLTDGVVLAMDTSQTLITPALVGVGTSTAVLKQNINSGGPQGATVFTPTVSKWVDVYVGAGVGVGYCEIYENDVLVGQFSVASGPDTAKLMFPWILFKDLGTSKTIDLDVFELITERNTR